MRVKEFAELTGCSEPTIRRYIVLGEIDAEYIDNRKGYDIKDGQVDEWKKRKENMRRGRPYIGNDYLKKPIVSITKHKYKNLLTASMLKLAEYNKLHQTNYSYGEATSRGII